MLNNPKFATIKAIKNKQVYKLPTMDIGGPRAPLISLYIALKAHPEAFKGVDINAIVKDYYKVVFDLKDAEVEPFLWHWFLKGLVFFSLSCIVPGLKQAL